MQLIKEIWRLVKKGLPGINPTPVQIRRSCSSASDGQQNPRRRSVNGTAMDGRRGRDDTTESCRERKPEKERALLSDAGSLAMVSGIRSDAETERRTSRSTSTVLVVDDEESIRNLVRTTLTREGRHVLLASRGPEAIEMFRRQRPDITILDLHMPGMSGIEVLRQIRTLDPQAIVMVFTGTDTEVSVREAKELGVTEFLHKGPSLLAEWEARSRGL